MSRDEGSSLAYFLLGAAVGAGLGLLLAPRAGKETRQRLADWLEENQEKGAEFLAKMKDAIPEKKEQFAAAFRAGKEAYQEASRHDHERA